MSRRFVILCISILIGLTVTYVFGSEPKAGEMQQEIAQKVLRFHVLANSDSEEDQCLKLKVKEAVVEYLSPYLDKDNLTLEEAKKCVEEQKKNVIAVAENIISENGYHYSVTAELTKDYFPVKSYGDVTLPAGEYEAFRIKIGEAKGKNWWCILYPPLCFVDVSYGFVPEESKETLHSLLEEDAYQLVVNGGLAEDNVEVRFKLGEILRSFWK